MIFGPAIDTVEKADGALTQIKARVSSFSRELIFAGKDSNMVQIKDTLTQKQVLSMHCGLIMTGL